MVIMKLMCRCLKKSLQTVSKEEVLKRVAALEFDRFLKYYENAEDLNTREDGKKNERNKISKDKEVQETERSRMEEEENSVAMVILQDCL